MKSLPDKIFIIILISSLFMVLSISHSSAEITVKLRDISYIDGIKENQVFGYGLVVGLQGTGDTRKAPINLASLQNVLKSLGLDGNDMISRNSAAVLITAQLPPFVRVGDRIDVTVSSIGDAKSIEGGILIQSPLKGADDAVYVVAQGSLSVSKNKAGGKSVKTVAYITGGGMVEKDIAPVVVNDNSIFIVLKAWDYTVANNIIKAVTKKYPDSKPEAKDGRIKIGVKSDIPLSEFISTIEVMEIPASYKARVVINERDGTIVTGGDVKISESMVSREGLMVEIQNSDKKAAVTHFKNSSTVKDLVDALNSIGAATSDIISILKALDEAGSLHAELIIK